MPDQQTDSRMFPILGGRFFLDRVYEIPWEAIAPHDGQALKNHSQSLVRLAERGGLSPDEAVAVLEDRDWRRMNDKEAMDRLMSIVWRGRRTEAKDVVAETRAQPHCTASRA